jgi:hypothetical protein
MNIERAFNLVHNLDIPEEKRKFWQQWSTVVVNTSGEIIDVIKHFEAPNLEINKKHLEMYPNTFQFTVAAGEMFTTIEKFDYKVKDAVKLGRKY